MLPSRTPIIFVLKKWCEVRLRNSHMWQPRYYGKSGEKDSIIFELYCLLYLTAQMRHTFSEIPINHWQKLLN